MCKAERINARGCLNNREEPLRLEQREQRGEGQRGGGRLPRSLGLARSTGEPWKSEGQKGWL